MALGHEIMTREVWLDRPEVPIEVQGFLYRCLQRKRALRWASATEALPTLSFEADKMRWRLRDERHRENWVIILEKGLLEQFAASHKGQLPPDAVQQFAALARQEGIAEVDEERLKEILGPIFDCASSVAEAEQDVLKARQRFQQDAAGLTENEVTWWEERIDELEKTWKSRRLQVREKIEDLLLHELWTWQEKQEAERRGQVQLRTVEPQRPHRWAIAAYIAFFLVFFALLIVGRWLVS
jgi:hypothetical protein